MEGWYFRLTLTQPQNVSFAFIVSIEDAGISNSKHRLACMQIVGPNDSYVVQAHPDDTKFWASPHNQSLGYTFTYQPHVQSAEQQQLQQGTALERDKWLNVVQSGFQILPTSFLGRIQGIDGTEPSALAGIGTSRTCEFDFDVEPVCGWGNHDSPKSTGGWLSHFSVFEPHWQVTVADGTAAGRVVWQNQTFDFDKTNAKFYAEKNWGAALPSKWFWTQCNSFEGYSQLSVTAGGGVRGIPFGGKESLGMVCVHYNHTFYEAVPWTGTMQWNVTKWGSWELQGRSTYGDHPFEVNVTYKVDPLKTPGLVFRAPTPEEGMVFFCRDTFSAEATLTLWELEWDLSKNIFVRKPGPPLIDRAVSQQGGAEVGGGPWWDSWAAKSQVSKPVLALLQIPVRIQALQQKVSRKLRRMP